MSPASFAMTDSPAPDNLFAGEMDRVEEVIVVKSGQVLKRGHVIGKITAAGATVAAKAGGNTGTGVLTLDVTTPILAGVKPGVYTVRITVAQANAGLYEVRDPDGLVIGDGVVAGAAFANHIKFAISDATDFIVGDGFDITIAAGTGKIVESVLAAIDGSGVPFGILVEDVDATAGDKAGSIYKTGDFNSAALTYGAGHSASTAATVDALRALNIYLRTVKVA